MNTTTVKASTETTKKLETLKSLTGISKQKLIEMAVNNMIEVLKKTGALHVDLPKRNGKY